MPETPVPVIRAELSAFVQLMELRLREHDAVAGDSWTLNTHTDLIARLDRCLKQARPNKSVAAWADVANYCAFIANVLDPTILSSQVLVGMNPNNSQRVALILSRIAEVEGFMRDERDQTDPTHGNRIVLELLGLVRGYFGEPGQRSISDLEVEVAGLGRLLAEVRARQVIGEARTLQLAKEIGNLANDGDDMEKDIDNLAQATREADAKQMTAINDLGKRIKEVDLRFQGDLVQLANQMKLLAEAVVEEDAKRLTVLNDLEKEVERLRRLCPLEAIEEMKTAGKKT